MKKKSVQDKPNAIRNRLSCFCKKATKINEQKSQNKSNGQFNSRPRSFTFGIQWLKPLSTSQFCNLCFKIRLRAFPSFLTEAVPYLPNKQLKCLATACPFSSEGPEHLQREPSALGTGTQDC